MSEETVIDNVESQEKSQNESKKSPTNSSKDRNKEVKSSSPSGQSLRRESYGNIASASAMAAAGWAVGLITPVESFPHASEIEDEIETISDSSDVSLSPEGDEIDVATSVDDSMSFNEAFAAARRELGAGGIFVWHGNAYGTYYAEEWDSMSEGEKEEYWSDVYETTSQMNIDVNNDDSEGELVDAEIESIVEDLLDDEIALTEEELEAYMEFIDDILADGMAEDFLEEGLDEGSTIGNPDIDLQASNETDLDLAIDNDMDMSEFA